MENREKQSFSSAVKEELVRLPTGKSCCMLSELSALTRTSGHLSFRGGGRIGVTWRLDNIGTARRLFLLLKKRLNVNPSLRFTWSERFGGRRTCVLSLDDREARTVLTALHMLEEDESGAIRLKRTLPRHPMTRQCCRRAYLRGAFLGAGTMTSPEKGYHFEWQAEDSQLAETLEKLLDRCGLTFHAYDRKGTRVICLKTAQQVADALALIGASSALLKMENIRINHQMRAAAVRAANCDEHNGEKMLDAAARQAEAIRIISLKQGLYTLPPRLRQAARLRLENTDLSLQELGERMDPPVSKNAVNHCMRRLAEIAGRIMREEETGSV